MNKIYVSEVSLNSLLKSLADKITKDKLVPNKIVCLAKGGLIPARMLAKYLGISTIYSIGVVFYTKPGETTDIPHIYQHLSEDFSHTDSILIVDDICDSGESMKVALEEVSNHKGMQIATCTIHYKPKSSYKPNYFAKEVQNSTWVDYFWE